MFVLCFCQKPSAGWVTRPKKADVCVCLSLSLSPSSCGVDFRACVRVSVDHVIFALRKSTVTNKS